jgi:hypothetical protein
MLIQGARSEDRWLDEIGANNAAAVSRESKSCFFIVLLLFASRASGTSQRYKFMAFFAKYLA